MRESTFTLVYWGFIPSFPTKGQLVTRGLPKHYYSTTSKSWVPILSSKLSWRETSLADRLGGANWIGSGDPFRRYRGGNVDPETQGLCRRRAKVQPIFFWIHFGLIGCGKAVFFEAFNKKHKWVTGSWYLNVLLYIESFYLQFVFFLYSLNWNIVETSTKAPKRPFFASEKDRQHNV